MITCPKCNGKDMRFTTNVFIDASISVYAKLTKRVLASSKVKVMGADWGRATFICPCGWVSLPSQPSRR